VRGLAKCWKGFILALVSCFWLAGAAAQTSLVLVPDGRLLAPDIARIVIRGELIVALLNKDTPPFVHQKNGVLHGVDIDLVQQVAQELKVPIRFDRSATTYDEVAQRVAIGQADIGVSKLARTLKRAQSVMFSTPYMHLQHALLINRLAFAKVAGDQSVSQAIRNFNGTIGVLAGSSWVEFARRNFPKAKTVRFANWPEAVEAVKKGTVVAVYRDAMEVRSVMRSDPSLALNLRTVTFRDLVSVLCVVVGSQDAVLQSFVNEIVSSQTEQLTVDLLLQRLEM
jgi:polar amino acid transport system substrate-binding protein